MTTFPPGRVRWQEGDLGMTRLKMILTLAVVSVMAMAGLALAANFTGTEGPDFIVGTAQNDTINSLGGDDSVFGLDGADRIDLGSGDDRAYGDGKCPPGANSPSYCTGGRKGNDQIHGGSGDDDIQGNKGNDRVSGQ